MVVSPLTTLDAAAVQRALDAPFPNPLGQSGPSEAAAAAAGDLLAGFDAGLIAAGLPSTILTQPNGGKMFGVLVVETSEGGLGYLKAFSGMLDGRWDVAGFVPPLFDRAKRDGLEIAGEAEVKRLTAESDAATASHELHALREQVAELDQRHERARLALQVEHRARRSRRRRLRAQLVATSESDDELEALAAQSRADKSERRRLEQAQSLEARDLHAALKRNERRLAARDRLRRMVSRSLMRRIHDCYEIPSADGSTTPLRQLFTDREPPAGAGDCAGPKLLSYALRNDLRPVALAEFWYGAGPVAGGRISGLFYPACRGKCGPLLPTMLRGLASEAVTPYMPPDSSGLELEIVYEDEALVVVNKPSGLLSVPSMNLAIRDSVTARLLQRYPGSSGQMLVHRLDMDTSGLLVAALDAKSFANLQGQFARRVVEKHYIACLDGALKNHEDECEVALALRVDVDDRPRHIHDPVDGKPALTRCKVLERNKTRTRVLLRPQTGRTHQLRVHAAHPLGLGTPIVGDRLYGRGGSRLLLHATRLRLRHPKTGAWLELESPAPF